MSEVSLRDYFSQLDTLLSTNAADEVIHHCRHILQYYPRNVAAYRYLGRALILNGRWDEGASALRRVLGVIPDDYIAHIGMSEIYDTKRQPDEAIWHLERAFEQTPYNRDLLDGIRALYRRYRNVDQVKIQLTAAAVARQAMRNQQYGQAIETLRGALERQPDRLDLRLLLAEALWAHGEQVEAAEIALDILQLLPDCLAANRILTQLWLAEDRPSDAQRYLSHIEDVDPYLAVELATGRPAPNDAFKLRELDYARSAQHELARNRPDWLQALDDESLTPQTEPKEARSTTGWVGALLRGAGAEAASPALQQEGAADLFSDDWMASVGRSIAEGAPIQADELPDDAALLGISTSAPDSIEHTPPDFSFEFEDELDNGLPDWELLTGEQAAVNTPFAQATALQAREAPSHDDELDFPQLDPLAWLRETNIEIDEATEPQDPFALETDEAAEMQLPEADANPLGWLGGYDDLLIQEEQTATAEGAISDLDDPLDWLNSVDLDDEPAGETATEPDSLDQSLEADWLRISETGFETAEAPLTPAEAPTIPSPPVNSLFDFIDNEPEIAGSEPSDDVDWLTDISNHEPQAVPGPRRGLTALLNESNFDWLSDQQNDASSAEPSATDSIMDEWLAEFGGTTPALPDQPSYEPDWIIELDSAMNDELMKPPSPDQPPDWGAGLPLEADDEAESASNVGESSEIEWGSPDAFAWPAEKEGEAHPTDSLPDWLAELQPTSTFESAQPVMSISNEDEPDEESEADPELGAVPDWLADLEPRYPSETTGMSFGASPENTALSAQDDWLTEIEAEEAAEMEDEAAVDWLQNVDDVAAELAAIEASLSSAGFQSSPLAGDEALLPEVPDWMGEFGAQPIQEDRSPAETVDSGIEEAFAAAQPIKGGDLEWLDDVGEQAAEQAAAELEATLYPEAGVPDWLSELEPQASTPAADTSAENIDWLDEIAPATPKPAETLGFEERLAAEEPLSSGASPASDLPDWLIELAPDEPFEQDDQTAAEETSAEPSAFDFNAIMAEPAATVGEPERSEEEWLTGIGAAAMASTDSEASLDDEETFNSESSEQPISNEQGEELDDEEWLIETPVETQLPAHEPLALGEYEAGAQDEDFEWLSEDEEADFATVETSFATYDSLDQDEEDAEETAAIDETVEALAIHGDVLVQKPASNAPDWLNAMVPGLDVDFEAIEEDEPIEQAFAEETADFDDEAAAPANREFGWLSEIVEQEETAEAAVEQPRPRFAFGSRPAWLKFSTKPAWMKPKPSDEASRSATHDQELPDWPDEPRDAEGDSDIPDWLR
ncbi:MAG: tetratricopeptide repeat protein [Aggregatilineales bacterium]